MTRSKKQADFQKPLPQKSTTGVVKRFRYVPKRSTMLFAGILPYEDYKKTQYRLHPAFKSCVVKIAYIFYGVNLDFKDKDMTTLQLGIEEYVLELFEKLKIRNRVSATLQCDIEFAHRIGNKEIP